MENVLNALEMNTFLLTKKVALMTALSLFLAAVHAAEQRDRFGGWPGVKGQVTGFFHAEQIDGVWWLVTPDGNAFFSKGVNNVSYAGDQCAFAGIFALRTGHGREVWLRGELGRRHGRKRLQAWGFNTVGAWSSPVMFEQRMAYTPVLNLAASAGANWLKGEVADVFSPQFKAAVHQRGQTLLRAGARPLPARLFYG